ncbi:MAG: hypothetical protein DRP01_02155 [Archaeoglobales archaeon]|nr:MAG: hypothetical protein DRP01_02155 [Archaeoglobales archaeon]
MAQDDFSKERTYRTTEPFDPEDPPRFGQLIETAKDAIASEIRRFLSYQPDDIRAKIGEFPTIEKFAHGGVGSTSQSMETVMNLIQSYGDTPDKFPMIAITSASMREKPLGLGDVFVVDGQRAPGLVASNEGPYDLTDGWELRIKTWPLGTESDPVESTIVLADIFFSDMSKATPQEVIQAVNAQMLYSHAAEFGGGSFKISAGGPAAHGTRNGIEVIGGTPDCLLALGFSVGEIDLYTSHIIGNASPVKRYGVAADMTINIDVVSDSLNTRTALADLVYDFFAFYMARNFFQILGRSYQNHDQNPPEWYHLILERKFAWAGEYATPRQGGDQQAQVYSIRGSVPLIAADYIDREVKRGAATFIVSTDVIMTDDHTLPTGDYFGSNYLKID